MIQQNNMKQLEQGRSMVEMLGVLAIIGVLSIGGIAGYTMAMNKHRANELLDGGSKRAMVAMQQIALGYNAADVSFAEFTGEDGFTGSPVAIQGGELGIHVNGVKQAVCETLVNMVDGENVYVAVEEGEDTVAALEDSDDCDTDPMNILLVYKMGQSAGTGGGDDDDDSCTLTAADCINGLADGECACAPASGATCTSHTDTACGSGYYCKFSLSSCSASGSGVCTALSGGTEITPAGDSSKTYLMSNYMNWWSANSWCAANGGSLITGTIAGHALNSDYEDPNGNGDIYTYFGNPNIWFWTGYDSGDSCNAWFVASQSNYESVYDTKRNFSRYRYTLCAFD